jgi:hypothetical protein
MDGGELLGLGNAGVIDIRTGQPPNNDAHK